MFRLFERLVQPYPETEPQLPSKRFFAFIWGCTRGLHGYIIALTLLSAAASAFEALMFLMLSRVVDWLALVPPERLWAERGTTLFWLAAVLAGTVLLAAAQTVVKHQALAVNFPLRLRWNFHRLMLGQSMSFFADEFAGRVTTKVMQTALSVREVVFTTCDMLVYIGVYFITVVVLAASFDTRLLWPFIAWMLLYAAAVAYFVPRLGRVGKAQADARSKMTGRITDAYTNISTIKLFSHTRREAYFARAAMNEFMITGYAQMRLVSAFQIVNQIMVVALVGSAAGLALWLWTQGSVGVGAVAAVSAMALRVAGMSHWIMWQMTGLFESVGTVQDGISTLTRERIVVDSPNAATLEVPRGEVRFEHLRFAYGRKDGQPIIDDLSLTVRAGEKIGLIGRSGAGKSTLVNLLLRFHDLEGGRIIVDGQDIAGVTQDSLRSHIGMVTQDTSLLHRSMGDNIRYGRPESTEEQMIAAAQRAEAHDFITGLSDPYGRRGYDAHVGERGVKLSGGQRQRVAIARVMLKDAPILLLDEATSALDSEVEAAIQASLNTLMQGKTVIAIAHRLSTIAAMDRLVVMDGGRIIEQGTHRELLERNGLYARLWAHQSGGFLVDDGAECAVEESAA